MSSHGVRSTSARGRRPGARPRRPPRRRASSEDRRALAGLIRAVHAVAVAGMTPLIEESVLLYSFRALEGSCCTRALEDVDIAVVVASLPTLAVLYWSWRRFEVSLGRVSGASLSAGSFYAAQAASETACWEARAGWSASALLFAAAFLVAPSPSRRDAPDSDLKVRAAVRRWRKRLGRSTRAACDGAPSRPR